MKGTGVGVGLFLVGSELIESRRLRFSAQLFFYITGSLESFSKKAFQTKNEESQAPAKKARLRTLISSQRQREKYSIFKKEKYFRNNLTKLF